MTYPRRSGTPILAILAVSLVLSAAAPATAQWRVRNCTTAGQNLFVRDVLQDLYFWDEFLPDPNPVAFTSPEAYLEAVRYRPLDVSFSYITSKAAQEALFSASQFIGFGFSNQTSVSTGGEGGDRVEMRVTQVFPGSPAEEAGLSRGDRILAINGVPVLTLYRAGQLGSAFGPSQEGYTTRVTTQRRDESPVEFSMTKRVVTIPTVSLTRVYEVDGRRVGYVFFRNFVQPSIEALDVAFAELRAARVTELVLDLRYNGGGLVSVAQHLASLIGGQRTNGQVLAEYFHNDRNAFRNEILRFEPKDQALTLDRLVVITTRSSASASELVINALRPFMPVIVVGDRTYGKPVGQYGIDFCDKVLAPVAFTLRNANGEGDFFDGFSPQCTAADDLDRQLGDPEEGSLGESLSFLRTGACRTPPPAAAGPQRLREGRTFLKETGFRQVIGAW